ncbi:MAG: YceI family protein [Microbacterium sp.]
MTIDIPGYKAGTYAIDASHSEVGFEVRHMMIARVRGHFGAVSGTITLPENLLEASVDAKVETASVSTKDDGRDAHLRSADFFDTEQFPEITFVSTAVREDGGDLVVDGDLTIKGITKKVTFTVEVGGFGGDPFGNFKAGGTATTTINREDFGLTWNAALETGGVLVGKDVKITLDLEAVFQA